MKFKLKKDRIKAMLGAAQALHKAGTNAEGRAVNPKFKNPGAFKYNVSRSIRSLTEAFNEIDADVKELVAPYWTQQREIDVAAEKLSPTLANEFQKEAAEFWKEEVEVDLRQVRLSDMLLDENTFVDETAIAELIDTVIIDDFDKSPPPEPKER